MILIKKPIVYTENGKAFLKAPIEISEDTAEEYRKLKTKLHKVHWRVDENYPPMEWKEDNWGCWFSVDEEYAKYLCVETADAFVVAMLWYAMMTGSDIVSEADVSDKLLFDINNYLIPALCTNKNGLRRITVSGEPTKRIVRCFHGVGTGMSCGIDSLYTLWKYSDSDLGERQLTHLTYFNMGAIFHPDSSTKANYSIKDFYAKTDEMSEVKINNANEVAKRVGLPLISVASNIDSDIYRGAYGYTAVYRNCACVLAMQKLFSVYYCSSAGWPEYFDLSITEGSEHYEALLCQCLSTENCTFILSDYATRIEKTEAIADWNISWDYLDVCFNFKNCGHCPKCYRTLLTLDFLGAVDNYNKVFNISEYKNSKAKALGWLLYARLGNSKDDNAVFAKDIYKLAKDRKIIFPLVSYGYFVKNIIVGILVKIYHRFKYDN